MSNWLAPIKSIFDAETSDLRKLAETVGANPTFFYVGRDLTQCDLKGQDLRGMDFTRAKLNPALMDSMTKLDPKFDPRFEISPYLQIGLREEVLAMAYAFAEEVHYQDKAWALKALLEMGVKNVSNKEVTHIIGSNDKIKALTSIKKGRMRRLTLNVYPIIQSWVAEFSRSTGRVYDRDSYNEIVLAGLMRQFIDRRGASSYASIEPLEIFKGAAHYLQEIRRGKRFVG